MSAHVFPSRRPLLLGFATLAALGAGLFGWGGLSSIAGAVIAAGQVEVETRDQVVEHIDGGTVAAILVRDGDTVEAGEVLVRFDDPQLRAERAMLEAEHAELVARRNRLEAEFRDADVIAWEESLVESSGSDASVRDILASQQRLFEARRRSRSGRSAQLAERVKQTEQQVVGLGAQADAVDRQAGYIARELQAQRRLFDKKLTTLRPLLALEREAARIDGDAGDIAARMAAARGRIAELELQILEVDTRRVEEAEGEARKVRAQENQVIERLGAVERRLEGLEVQAPVSGEVYGMRVFAPGEVVGSGEPILSIVPEGAGLVVLAQLDPIHVDQLYAGQEAVLRFSSFPARNTPEFEAQVTRVGADVQVDPATGFGWYDVELAVGSAIESDGALDVGKWFGALSEWMASLVSDSNAQWPQHREQEPDREAGRARGDPVDRALRLSPGMPVEVYVRTEARTPLDYLAKPLTDYFMRSLRED